MNEFWVAVLAGLAVAAVVALVAWIGKPLLRKATAAWQDSEIEANELAEEAEANELETLREQVVERARAIGAPMAVSASGSRVTYADGKVSTFIPDFGQYRAAMTSRRVDILRTINKPVPMTLAQRDRAWMEHWLREHP